MCIQWCCKNCANTLTKLPHRWAREPCNEYFIARSQNQHTTACPAGPWQLRRAYHRHPYRGPQTCDDCKRTRRKDKKFVRLAKQKANLALGQRPEYSGAVWLGELEVPEGFQGKVDRMRGSWERFSEINGHLEEGELEREWAGRFAGLNGVGVSGGGFLRLPKLAETFPSLHQQSHHHSTSSTCQQNSTPSPGTHLFIQYNPNLPAKKSPNTNTRGAACPSFRQFTEDIKYKYNISDTDMHAAINKQNNLPVGEQSSRTTHYHKVTYNIRGETTNENDRSSTSEAKEASKDSDRGDVHCESNTTSSTRSSSSQATRTRPWDL